LPLYSRPEMGRGLSTRQPGKSKAAKRTKKKEAPSVSLREKNEKRKTEVKALMSTERVGGGVPKLGSSQARVRGSQGGGKGGKESGFLRYNRGR